MPAKLTDEGSLVPRPARRRRPHTTAALAATYPLRCFAPQWARFDNRHSISAPAPILSLHQRQRRRDSFAPRRERFLCLRRPHFFQQRKKWGKERRQKLRFCTSSARYTRQRFAAYSRGHSLSSPLSVKRTACTLTGAEADAAACPRHGRRFSLLPPSPKPSPQAAHPPKPSPWGVRGIE